MKNIMLLKATLLLFLFSSCIQDDIIDDEVPETLRITASIDTLGVGDSYQFTAQYTNNIGQIIPININWMSSDENIANIDNNGLAIGISTGTVNISAEVQKVDQTTLSEVFEIVVDQETIIAEPEMRSGIIAASSFYTLEGDFTITEMGDSLRIEFASNYVADQSLPGLYVYLSNNPTTTNGALEIGAVTTFIGEHSYDIPNTGIDEYSHLLYFCKPFRVKVGDGEILE